MSVKEDVWKLLKQDSKENPGWYGVSVENSDIKTAELILHFEFSESYKFFLKLYGAAGIYSIDVYGLNKPEYGSIYYWSVVERTQHFWKEKWPGVENWYIVADDGNGNPFGIDKDGVVWISDHDAYEGEEVEKVADNFEEFLYKLVTDTLWD